MTSTRFWRGHLISFLSAFLLLGCQSKSPKIPTVTRDPTIPGVIVVDVLESGHPDKYILFELTPSTGSLRTSAGNTKQRNAVQLWRQQTVSFATGWLKDCELFVLPESPNILRYPSAESPDKRYTAVCRVTDRGHVRMEVMASEPKTIVWSRDFDEGWEVEGFGWNPQTASLAVLVRSSFPRRGGFWEIPAFLGHPEPDVAVYVIIISAESWSSRNFLVAEHLDSSMVRLLEWKSLAD